MKHMGAMSATTAGLVVGAVIGLWVGAVPWATAELPQAVGSAAVANRAAVIQSAGITLEQAERMTGQPVSAFDVYTNKAGLTYGSAVVGLIEGRMTPDLVIVVMDDGHKGYVRSSELAQPVASNPDEAVRMMRDQEAAAAAGQSGPVLTAYDSEGNPIGTFTLGNR